MGNIKNFVGEYAYNMIKNIAIDEEALRKALVTPQNAREVFSELSEFDVKSLCTEISNSGKIGQIRETTQEEIIKVFNSIGYDQVIFNDETKISECKKYYKSGEVICTYNDLKSRMREYHMLVAVKSNIDEVERSKNPQREDEYGTSILNIQIARNGSHMSIKNRYNHTVSQPDSTLNNNLDMLYMGLQSMVLGYYGFASLNSKKAHYNNIVNIGGIYLKYHTEKNNIYYGSFVLDGVNGVRFTDTSRYYVTMGNKDRYYNQPIVLDFKDKKAIDLSQDKGDLNGRVPLLTRALQEGILSSTNKTEADILKATFQNSTKELLLSRKKAFNYIHDAYGYDYTKPYKVTGFLGVFTAKSIEKETGSDTGILLVYSKGEMRVCELSNGKFYAKDLRRISGYNNINKFYGQGDFETERKSGNTAMYFIQQEKQYIGKAKPEERKSYYYQQRSPELDKSGYDLSEVRVALSHRLSKYKTEKRAKEASELDYTQDITEIENSFASLKADLITDLTNAKTPDDYSKIKDAMSYEFVWIVKDIENIKVKANTKSFSSVESAKSKIKEVKEKIINIRSKIA